MHQRPQSFLTRCARDRAVVLFEEPTFDTPIPELEIIKGAPGVLVAAPHLPPGTPAQATERAQQQLLDRMLGAMGVSAPLLWFYTPMALGFAGHLESAAVVYDRMDELSLFRGAHPELLKREIALLQKADVVFTTGHGLFEHKRDLFDDAPEPSTDAWDRTFDQMWSEVEAALARKRSPTGIHAA